MTNKIEPPIGEQPEGNLDALGKLDEATKKLFANLDRLGENIKKLTTMYLNTVSTSVKLHW